MIPQTEEKARLLEFAALQAAQEEETPVLARPMHLYRTRNRLTMDQFINWLGLRNREEFYRLSLSLKPSHVITPLDWRDYSLTVGERFPSLNLKRLRLILDSEKEQITLALSKTAPTNARLSN